jgi:hypothetical protein
MIFTGVFCQLVYDAFLVAVVTFWQFVYDGL